MDDLLTLIADQADTIGRQASELERYKTATPEYWECLYGKIEHAMEDYCLATVGQRRPQPAMVPDEALRELVRAVL